VVGVVHTVSHLGERLVTDEIMDRVARVVERVTGMSALDPAANLFERGMTSMMCVRIMVEIESGLDVTLPEDFFSSDTFVTLDALNGRVRAVLGGERR
jgi:acyl carrier protein